MSLRVWSNGVETYAAVDMADLAEAVRELQGCALEDLEGDEDWAEVDPEHNIRIYLDPDDLKNPPPFPPVFDHKDGGHLTYDAPAKDWAEWNGRGLICSTEY